MINKCTCVYACVRMYDVKEKLPCHHDRAGCGSPLTASFNYNRVEVSHF